MRTPLLRLHVQAPVDPAIHTALYRASTAILPQSMQTLFRPTAPVGNVGRAQRDAATHRTVLLFDELVRGSSHMGNIHEVISTLYAHLHCIFRSKPVPTASSMGVSSSLAASGSALSLTAAVHRRETTALTPSPREAQLQVLATNTLGALSVHQPEFALYSR